jgi:hypothetical protein
MGPSASWRLVLTLASGISSSLGLSVFVVVETEDGAMAEKVRQDEDNRVPGSVGGVRVKRW